jgi:hypothetical protein
MWTMDACHDACILADSSHADVDARQHFSATRAIQLCSRKRSSHTNEYNSCVLSVRRVC